MSGLPLRILLILTSIFSASSTEVTLLTDEEYQSLPKLLTLEHYGDCLVPRNAAFCLATFNLTAPSPTPLYDILKNITSFHRVYYDHTLLHRGVCVTKSCSQFLNSSSLELDALVPALEACVNDSVYKEYGLEARMAHFFYCKRSGVTEALDFLDYTFAATIALLLLLNLAGTIYEACTPMKSDSRMNWLMAFSLRANWNKLTVLREDNTGDPRLNNLKAIQGMRTISMFFVICGHVLLIPTFRVPPENSHFVEQLPFYRISSLLQGGLLFMQTFMVMASFLLSYNLSVFMETRKKFGWGMYFVGIAQRFLRLVPTYMLVVWFSATWLTRLTSGPLCGTLEEEKEICRDKWWLQLLFLHNIFNASNMCLGQAWYLAVDMQLFVLGLLLMKLLWGRRHIARRALVAALVLATMGQVLYTYVKELRPPQLMQTPEVLRTLFKTEPSFWLLYTAAPGNIQGYLVGLLLGLEYYRLEVKGDDFTNKKLFRWAYQLCFPLGFAYLLAVHPYRIADHPQIYVSLYAAFDRLFFAVLISIFLLGMFRSAGSDVYRGMLAWRGWQATGRLTYAALLLHILVYMNLSCSREYPRTLALYAGLYDWIGTVVVTYLLAVPLTLMVEYPIQTLTKSLFTPAPIPIPKKKHVDLNGNLIQREILNGSTEKDINVKKIE